MKVQNIQFYTLNRELDFQSVENYLTEHAIKPCSGSKRQSIGFTSPIKEGEHLAHFCAEAVILLVETQVKSIPHQYIKDTANARIAEMELTGTKLKATEKNRIKDDVTDEVVKSLYPKKRLNRLFLFPKERLIAVEASTTKNAEACLGLLRKAIGSLPVVQAASEAPIPFTLTQWMKKGAPKGFSIGSDAAINDIGTSGSIRFKGQDLSEEGIQLLLEHRLVNKLRLHFEDRWSFSVSDWGGITQFVTNEFAELPSDDEDNPVAIQDAEYVHWVHTLRDLYHVLCQSVYVDEVDSEQQTTEPTLRVAS